MGKTTFAMNLVENAVLRSDKAVLVYSLEMPGESLIMRMLSSLAVSIRPRCVPASWTTIDCHADLGSGQPA
jgi:replicative DNA helicase